VPSGNAWLIKRTDGKHELVGGNAGDFTEAKEWVSLFAHDVVFSRPVKREQKPTFHLKKIVRMGSVGNQAAD
jgi:hypothetical protein